MTSSPYTQANQKSPWDGIERMYVRTRGPLPIRSTRVSGHFASVIGLVQDIRKQVDGLPLTFVLHDWGEPETASFLSDLEPVITANDTVWLLPSGHRAGFPEKPPVGRLLDLDRERDHSLYQMMIGDVVFFGGTELSEQQVHSWGMRARSLIVQDGKQFSNRIKSISVRMTRKTYLRLRDGELKEA
jgi:hypothetical protein